MKISVDLTNKAFNSMEIEIHFYDSKTIFFEPTNTLPRVVSFPVWGASVLSNFEFGKYLNLDSAPKLQKVIEKSKDTSLIQIQGFGQLTFNAVIAGSISIFPYDKGQFIKRENGTTLEYKREWNLDKIDQECFEYEMDTSIYFPYGASYLKIYSKGNVIFEFDPEDCVSYHDYITNPNKEETFWGYLKNKELNTNSYKFEDLVPNS